MLRMHNEQKLTEAELAEAEHLREEDGLEEIRFQEFQKTPVYRGDKPAWRDRIVTFCATTMRRVYCLSSWSS
jgi:ribosomal protein S19E (S16A)